MIEVQSMPTRRAAIVSCLAVLCMGPFCMIASAIARSEEATETYLAARNRYIADETAAAKAVDLKAEEIRKGKGDTASNQYLEAADKTGQTRLQKELGDLKDRLSQLIGPVSVKGLPEKGEINLTELAANAEIGFGLLDGLSFRSEGGGLELVVTTDALLKNWLRENKDRTKSQFEPEMPQEFAQALRFGPFYTAAIEGDAGVEDFGDIAVVPTRGDEAVYAQLVEITQDRPATPSHIIAAVVTHGKIFILTQPLTAPLDHISRCDAVQEDADRRRKKVVAEESAAADRSRPADAPPGAREQKLLQQEDRIDADADVAYRKCFFEEARKQGYFPAITRQAQALVDLIPPN